jgi:hypothetical protein
LTGKDGEAVASRKEAKKARREKRKQRAHRAPGDRPTGPPPVAVASGQGDVLLMDVPGMEKMSVVLEKFVWPFLEETNFTSEVDCHNLFTFAAAAWNIALHPEAQHQAEIDELVTKMTALPSAGFDAEAPSYLRLLLARMIARKKAHFAQNRRVIGAVEVTKMGKTLHVNVISSPPPQ